MHLCVTYIVVSNCSAHTAAKRTQSLKCCHGFLFNTIQLNYYAVASVTTC